MKSPTITTGKIGPAINIDEECTKNPWFAPKRSVGKDAEIFIDMKCAIKLQAIYLQNLDGDFGTKEFSLYGSHLLTGPWNKLKTWQLQQSAEEVCSECVIINIYFL